MHRLAVADRPSWHARPCGFDLALQTDAPESVLHVGCAKARKLIASIDAGTVESLMEAWHQFQLASSEWIVGKPEVAFGIRKGLGFEKFRDQPELRLRPELCIFLFIPRCPPGRSLCSLVLQLNGMRIDNCQNQPGKTLLNLRAPRSVMHFNAPPFPTDQPGLSQRSEVLRERGLRNRLVADSQECRTVLRALLRHDVCVDGHPCWVC